jgi:TRAP-type C4-dicarboxylate transport system permease small subunit
MITVVKDLYKGRFRIVMCTFIDFLSFILFLVLGISGIMLMNLSAGQNTPSLEIPKMAVYAAVPYGCAVMLIELTLRCYRRFTGILKD